MANCIEYDSVSFTYDNNKKSRALKDVSFSIKSGSKFAIMGPNGAGKTTLFKLAVGLLNSYEGKVRVFGKEVNNGTKKEVRRLIGYLFQNPDDQLFAPTVWEDVAFGPRNLGMTEAEVKEVVNTTLEEMGMKEYASRPPFQLSEGQKKRVAIAGLLAMRPKMLLLDEPTSDLDIPTVHAFFEKISQLVEEGITVVISTHDILFARKWAEDCVILREGSVLFSGSPVEAFARKEVCEAVGDPNYFHTWY